MKKRFAIMAVSLLSFALIPLTATAAGGGEVKLQQANVDVGNHAAIQRGAKYFVNYCLSCHSASYMRYNRMGEDLGVHHWPDDLSSASASGPMLSGCP